MALVRSNALRGCTFLARHYSPCNHLGSVVRMTRQLPHATHCTEPQIDLSRSQQNIGLGCQVELIYSQLKHARIHLHIDTMLTTLPAENIKTYSVYHRLDFDRGDNRHVLK
jgi:hypothetical protein